MQARVATISAFVGNNRRLAAKWIPEQERQNEQFEVIMSACVRDFKEQEWERIMTSEEARAIICELPDLARRQSEIDSLVSQFCETGMLLFAAVKQLDRDAVAQLHEQSCELRERLDGLMQAFRHDYLAGFVE